MRRMSSLVYLKFLLVTLIFIYLCLQAYLVMKKKASERADILSNESVLCGNSTVNKLSYTKRKCPKRGITTFVEGSLTEHMWQYANVLAISLELGMEGYIPICLNKSLKKVFSNLSLPLLADITHCDMPLQSVTEPVEDWKAFEGIWAIRPTYFVFNTIILKHIDVIRRHFVVKKNLQDLVSRILIGAPYEGSSVTYVGLYISTTVGGFEISDPEHFDIQFILSAMDKFREDYKNSFFIVITKNKGAWSQVFGFGKKDIWVMDQDIWIRPAVSFALLSRCSHNIIVEYEFGPWAAILSGGDAIVSFSLNEGLNPLMKLCENWKYLISEAQYEQL